MTRQARIGLLVGLGFIILFGVLMSELTGRPSAPPIDDPMGNEDINEYVWAPVVEEIPAPRPQRIERLSATVEDDGGEDGEPAAVVQVETDSGRDAQAAHQSERRPAAEQARRRPAKTYTVQPNDNLIKIAKKVYGPGHKDEYKRIYKANRNVLSSESLVVEGQELVIPPLPGSQNPRPQGGATASQNRTTGDYRQMDVNELRRHFSNPRGRSDSGRIYVIRHGDNLTGIARRYLNDGSKEAVMKIYNANRDKLKNPNDLPVGVRIVIPSQSG